MKKRSFFELYLTLVSAFSLFIAAISLAVIISKLGSYYFISWEEYKQQHIWELKAPCENIIKTQEKGKFLTSPECIQENEKRLFLKRKIELKKTLITYIPLFFIFLLIFGLHYYLLLKINKKEKL